MGEREEESGSGVPAGPESQVPGPRPPPDQAPALRLYRWRDPTVIAIAFLAMASGFGQFGAVAALGDVAKAFGHVNHGATVADQAGLSGTVLGVGLAILRAASLGGLFLAGLADRFGRRSTMLVTCAIGLVFTLAAAASPSYWWFVAIFALGRPLLSAAAAVAQVAAAEHTAAADRAKAVALIAAGYSAGAGLTAVIHGLAEKTLGFRGLFALSVIPLVALVYIGRFIIEPDRFNRMETGDYAKPAFGSVGQLYRRRLVVVSVLAFAVSVCSGPATSFLFVYAQNVRHISGVGISLMVVVAGVFGLLGLFSGRWMADHLGRRPTLAVSIVAIVLFAVFTYSGSRFAVLVGYSLGVFAGGNFAPAAGSFVNELFPTSVRATVAGWQIASGVLGAVVGLVVFGSVADIGNRFSIGATVTFLPIIPVIALLLLVPETRGREPEDLLLGP